MRNAFSKWESYAKQFLSDDLPLLGNQQSRGFLLMYSVGGHTPSDRSDRLCIQEDGTLILTRFELLDIPFLAQFAAEAGKADLLVA